MSPFRFDIDLFIKKPYPLLFAQQDIPNIYVCIIFCLYVFVYKRNGVLVRR